MRKQDWEQQLNAGIEAAKGTPFIWGQSDCINFAFGCAANMVDYDLMAKASAFRNYTTEAEAYQVLTDNFDGSMAKAMDYFFEAHVNKTTARRGDIVIIDYNDIQLFGIMDLTGRFAACKSENGVLHVPIKYATNAWKVD